MVVHELPFASHRLHAYVYDVGVPLQPPFEVESVCPCWAVPESVGDAVLTGALPAAWPLPGWPKTAPTIMAAAAIAIAPPMFRCFI
jgi:hypothetical protein